MVAEAWCSVSHNNGLTRLGLRLTATRKVLRWSFTAFGDIFAAVRDAKEEVKVAEPTFDGSDDLGLRSRLNKAKAALKQKEAIEEWDLEGDRNSAFFHSCVNRKQKKLNIHRIRKEDGSCTYNMDEIKAESISFCSKLF